MNILPTAIPEVLLIEPRVFEDERGFFFESFRSDLLSEKVGFKVLFVQHNHSGSKKNVLRGLHYQLRHVQAKLVRVVVGSIYDVVVDIRRDSETFGKWVAYELSAQNRRMLWIPEGFAHGMLTLADWNEVIYATTNFYAPQFERSILWSDPDLAIDWPLEEAPTLSAKDAAGHCLNASEVLT